ncbi:lysozyme [Archangium gephyra]|nr:lysozyme [Archangium gephyra]
MNEPRNKSEVRTPVEDGELSNDTKLLDEPEVGMKREAKPRGDSNPDIDETPPETDGVGSSREEQPTGPEAQFPSRFEGIQMRMRKGMEGSCVIGLNIELAFDKAKPDGEAPPLEAEDEMPEPEEPKPDGNSAGELEAESLDADEDFGDEELEAESLDEDEDFGDEELEAESLDEDEDFGDEELEAESLDEDEDFGDEELEAEGLTSPSLRAASGKRVAAAAPRKLRLSKRGAQFIARFEGIRQKLYNDPAGHCTIGIGHLVHRGRCNGREPAEFKKGITRDRAYALLQSDARRMVAAVHGIGVPLNQNQFDALVSFTYNLGPNWMKKKSGLRDALRARRYRDVPREMLKWVRAGGRVLPGLVRRRKAEGRLFATPVKPVPPKKPPVVKAADAQPGL